MKYFNNITNVKNDNKISYLSNINLDVDSKLHVGLLFRNLLKKNALLSLIMISTAIVISGCEISTDEQVNDTELSPKLVEIDDRVWSLSHFISNAGRQDVLTDTNITLSIDVKNKLLQGTGGCNRYSAEFSFDDEDNSISILNIGSTEMGCREPEGIYQQEQDFFELLLQAQSINFDQEQLTFTVDEDASLHFVSQPADQPLVQDKTWLLDFYYNFAGEQPIIANTEISLTIDLENGQLSGNAGCNHYQADFVLNTLSEQNEVGVFNITTSDIITTQIWCEEPAGLMAQEVDFLNALEQVTVMTIKENTVSLSIDEDNSIFFMNQATEELKLEGSQWKFKSVMNDADILAIIDHTEITLFLDKETLTLTGSAGCNNYSADYEIVGKSLRLNISNLVANERWCEQPAGIMQQEQNYLSALSDALTFSIDKDELVIISGGAAHNLYFSAE